MISNFVVYSVSTKSVLDFVAPCHGDDYWSGAFKGGNLLDSKCWSFGAWAPGIFFQSVFFGLPRHLYFPCGVFLFHVFFIPLWMCFFSKVDSSCPRHHMKIIKKSVSKDTHCWIQICARTSLVDCALCLFLWDINWNNKNYCCMLFSLLFSHMHTWSQVITYFEDDISLCTYVQFDLKS